MQKDSMAASAWNTNRCQPGTAAAPGWAPMPKSGRWWPRPWKTRQVGLPGAWSQKDDAENNSTPLAPEGTLARTWKERRPTRDSVFQTVEGGLGYRAGNHFCYRPPKVSMNATPQCSPMETAPAVGLSSTATRCCLTTASALRS
jgi:hypothetical protein